jgi:glycosyltransferase involved in cell wall biosynthesis
MLISVLIPAYNEQELIGRTIDSIHESFAAISWNSYEIVVCDNNSTDRTAEIALARGAIVVSEPHNQIAKARNTAARNAAGEWLVFLDADTLLNPDVLRLAIENLESGKVCGGGSIMAFDGDIGRICGLMCRHWNWLSRTFKLAAGAFIFCLREGFSGAGGFNEKYYVSEEIWFSKRLSRWGKKRTMKFVILSGHPVITSARKVIWYGQWRVLLQFLLFLAPGAIHTRRVAGQWYKRPDDGAKKFGKGNSA